METLMLTHCIAWRLYIRNFSNNYFYKDYNFDLRSYVYPIARTCWPVKKVLNVVMFFLTFPIGTISGSVTLGYKPIHSGVRKKLTKAVSY